MEKLNNHPENNTSDLRITFTQEHNNFTIRNEKLITEHCNPTILVLIFTFK